MPLLSLHTPVGDISLSEHDEAIVAVDWGWGSEQSATPLLRRAQDLLQRYFDGEPAAFDLPLAPLSGTAYQRAVWRALCAIPAGETRTYADLATTVGGHARAIGMASAANPIPILIPCHRVIARNGLGGYSGGDGVVTKRYLLALEARIYGGAPLLDRAGT
jgi:methylated-DNA-[protein]-cysteine S-methyltransferase